MELTQKQKVRLFNLLTQEISNYEESFTDFGNNMQVECKGGFELEHQYVYDLRLLRDIINKNENYILVINNKKQE